jgi:hypothetical protein
MDELKERIVKAAKKGAEAAIRQELGEDWRVEVTGERLWMNVRVVEIEKLPYGAPRYFKVQVSEPI